MYILFLPIAFKIPILLINVFGVAWW